MRVLLVDDHAMMRAGFRMILEAEEGVEVVGEAATGAEAVAAAAVLHPDVVSMDVQMPDMDGIEATQRIIAADATAKVMIVTTFDRDDYLFAALSAGASGFLLKNAGPEELITAIRVIAAGDSLLAPEVTGRVISRFARPAARVGAPTDAAASPLADTLTEREHEVLRLVAEPLSNAEIAQRLFIGESTVKTHVSNLLLKLGARDRVHAVVLAYRHGLV